MCKKGKSGENRIGKYGLLIALIIIIVFFQIITGGALMTPLNVTNILMQNSYIIILAIGMLYVIIAGDFDMSVGYGAGFIGAFAAVLLCKIGLPLFLVVLLAIIVGIGMGSYQGVLVAYFKIPVFVVTLGNMMVFRGLMLITLGSQTVGPTPDSLNVISTGYIPDIQFGSIKIITIIVGVIVAIIYIVNTARSKTKMKEYGINVSGIGLLVKSIIVTAIIMFLSLLFSLYNGIPNILLLLVIIIAIYSFIGNKTTLGRRVYALGGNEKATRLSGINTKKVKFLVFVNMGLLTAVSGLVFTARVNYATPSAGADFAMDAIAACFIGGASSKGGSGTIFGTIVGALVMGILNNGMQLLGLGTEMQQLVKGLVLIFAVLLDVVSKKENKF